MTVAIGMLALMAATASADPKPEPHTMGFQTLGSTITLDGTTIVDAGVLK